MAVNPLDNLVQARNGLTSSLRAIQDLPGGGIRDTLLEETRDLLAKVNMLVQASRQAVHGVLMTSPAVEASEESKEER